MRLFGGSTDGLPARAAAATLIVVGAALGCSDASAPAGGGGPATTPSPFIVSNPRPGIGAAAASANNASGSDGTVVYVALPPGSIPNADEVRIHARSSGSTVSGRAFDGGLDPVAVNVNAQDVLDVDVTLTSGASPLHFSMAVPGTRRPIVVRTSPPPRKRDVPLNLTVIIVFSEPIAPATLNTTSVRLQRGATLVAGTLAFIDDAHLTATVVPAAPLSAATDYTLTVTQDVQDLDGQSLEAPVSVQFTTVAADAPPSVAFASVTVGIAHSCALTTDGAAYCWGANDYGEFGNNSLAGSLTPIRVAEGLTFKSISAGDVHTCGLTTDGDAYCWGNQNYGQLGNGSVTQSEIPQKVTGGLKFASISTGAFHTCGVTTEGTAYCWGHGFYGSLGIDWVTFDDSCGPGQRVYCSKPVRVAGNLTFAALAAECGVTTVGRVYCWGSNVTGDLGIGTSTGPEQCPGDVLGGDAPFFACSLVPVAIQSGLTFGTDPGQIARGCAVAVGGAAFCWGNNQNFRVGAGTGGRDACPVEVALPSLHTIYLPCSPSPIAVSGGLSFKTVYSAAGASCGVTTAGAGYCWGSNLSGQLGMGSIGPEICDFATYSGACSKVPIAIAGGGLRFRTLAIGGYIAAAHACGVTETGDVYCWGNNRSGELGDGTTVLRPSPVRVANPR